MRSFRSPKFKSAILIFEEQVKKNPKKIAVDFGEEKITYEELNKRANKLASILVGSLNKTQQKIYVLLDKKRKLDSVIILLGILKSGNIFVPINLQLPPRIIKNYFRKIKPDFIITQKKYFDFLKKINKDINISNILTIESLDYDITIQFKEEKKIKENLRNKNNKYVYIYFTSGSVGSPKAVLGTAFALSYFIKLRIEKNFYLLKENFLIGLPLSFYSPAFPHIVIPTLCVGATLCLAEDDNLLLNMPKFIEWLENKRITCLRFLPVSLFWYFVESLEDKNELKNLEYLMVSGGQLRNDKYLKKFFDKTDSRIKLINIYGNTEAHLTFFYEVSKDDLNREIIPSAKLSEDLLGSKIMILDGKNNIQPLGGVGEVCIQSPAINADCGYYNNPELTNKTFIKNPFGKNSKDIILRTGDLGRLSPDGTLELLGRKDDQIKIRGWRVNLSEVERKILLHPDIKQCVVLAKKEKRDDNYLVAYYVSDRRFDEKHLVSFLKDYLPSYMLPSYFVRLAKLPLNFNHKIDRSVLAAIDEKKYFKEKSPRKIKNKIEKKLLNIWRKVLGRKDITIDDNFFYLGGHSLKAGLVCYELKKTLNYDLPLTAIYRYPTISELANFIKQAPEAKGDRFSLGKALGHKKAKEKQGGIEKDKDNKKLQDLSSEQRSILSLERISKESVINNHIIILDLEGKLNLRLLNKTFQEIIKRHHILRKNFFENKSRREDNEILPIQVSNQDKKFRILFFNLVGENKKTENKIIKENINKGFNLNKDFPFRVILLKKGEKKFSLVFLFHLIAFEAQSVRLFFRELKIIYEALLEKKPHNLSPLKAQYSDYIDWQKKFFVEKKDKINIQKKYWNKKLSENNLFIGSSFLKKLSKKEINKTDNFKALKESLFINKYKINLLNNFCNKYKIPPFIFSFSLVSLLLHKLTKKDNIIIDSFITKREKGSFQDVIGPMFNKVPFVSHLNRERTFFDFLFATKRNIIGTIKNSDFRDFYQLPIFKSFSDSERDKKLNISFEFDELDRLDKIGNLKVDSRRFDETRIFPSMVFYFSIYKDNQNGFFEIFYKQNFFQKDDIRELIEKFDKLLDIILENPKIKISEIKI